MNTAYEAQIRAALKQPVPKATSYTTTLPTVGFYDTSAATGILGKIAPYLIYALLITFVIMLILVIVHYTVTPIFNFGQNPDALINLTAPDFKKSWDDPSLTYSDTPANSVLPKNNFSFIFDGIVSMISPSNEAGNIFVFVYKTAATQLVQGGTAPSNPTSIVESETGERFQATKITDFSFLDTPQTPSTPTQPSLVVAYNSLEAKLVVYFVVTDGTSQYLKSVSAPISPLQKYRIGVVVTDKMVELYLNGQYTASKIYPGFTIHGTDTDLLVSAPSKYGTNVKAANIFLTNRVISSGEVRSMGGPADMKI